MQEKNHSHQLVAHFTNETNNTPML